MNGALAAELEAARAHTVPALEASVRVQVDAGDLVPRSGRLLQ